MVISKPLQKKKKIRYRLDGNCNINTPKKKPIRFFLRFDGSHSDLRAMYQIDCIPMDTEDLRVGAGASSKTHFHVGGESVRWWNR